MAKYQADRGLQNVRDTGMTREYNLPRIENKLFRHVFEDLRVDRGLFHYEHRLVSHRNETGSPKQHS